MDAGADPRWTFEEPRGCLRLAGAVLLTACVLGVVAVAFGTQVGELAWGVAMLLVVLAGLPLGVWLAFGHQGITVDVQRGTVQQWRRAIITVGSTFHSLSRFSEVTIARQKVRGVEDVSWLYHVQLWAADGPVEVWAPGSYEAAREVAVALSEHTGLPLTDRTIT